MPRTYFGGRKDTLRVVADEARGVADILPDVVDYVTLQTRFRVTVDGQRAERVVATVAAHDG